MQLKKIKRIAIILSIILILLNIFLYINMKSTWPEISSTHHQYESVSLIIVGLFRFGLLIWGILLIPIVWLEYLLINILMKIYSEFSGLKRILLFLITVIVIIILLILFIKIISLIIITLL